MNLFVKKYVIVSLFVLTNNFVAVLAGNATYKRKIHISEVLTSFLKIPWINLDSSWTDVVASACGNDITTLFKSAEAGEMWALQMLDAASKVPAGILTGNIWDTGMFDECIRVTSHSNPAKIQAQHCMVSLSIPTKFFENPSEMMRVQKLSFYKPSGNMTFGLSISVCVPSSCGIQDINGLINASIGKNPELGAFEVGVAKIACSDSEPRNEFSLGTILTLLFLLMDAILLLFCTVCDFVLRARSNKGSKALKNAAKFSLYTNALKLTSTEVNSDVMPALFGFRVINTFLIVFGHRVGNILFKPTVNLLDIFKMLQSVPSTLMFSLFFVNDTFFLIAGFLMAISFLKKLRSGAKLNVLVMYLHRYLRLTPCLAVVIFFVIFILPHLASGPNWQMISEHSIAHCQKNWWTNMLYVQNIVDAEHMCLVATWFLAAEVQLFCLSPIILYPLFYWPKLGLGILGLLLPVSFFLPAIQIVANNWSAIFAMHKSVQEVVSEFFLFHTITYNRALPYLLGILLGYDVLYNKRQLSERQVIVNWILASLFVIFGGWIVHHTQPNGDAYNVFWEATCVSVGRLVWSLAMAWVIYACTQGYGGPITNFLSLPIFVPLNRLCYCIYLVHLVLQMTTTGMQRSADFFTPFTTAYLVWGDLGLSIVIAFVLSLCFESPIIVLERILTSKQTSASTDVPGSVLKRVDTEPKILEAHDKQS